LVYMQQEGVRVAAFDATNSTKQRRRHIWKVLKESALGAKFMFVESLCDDEEVRWSDGVCCLLVINLSIYLELVWPGFPCFFFLLSNHIILYMYIY
jgi:6-phosphofructo-2-kinase